MTECFAYVRMSTEAQSKKDSEPRQRALAVSYAEKNGLSLPETNFIYDRGVSAFKGSNILEGELGQFIMRAEERTLPPGTLLLTESLDRITRQSAYKGLQLLFRIIEAGIVLVTTTDAKKYDGNTDYDALAGSLNSIRRAHEESELKSTRVSGAWVRKRSNALNVICTRRCPAWLQPKADGSGFDTLDEAAQAIRRIFQLASDGMGAVAITKTLNQELTPTVGNTGSWQRSYVKKILTNRAVTGEWQPYKRIDGVRRPVGSPIAGYYPRVVSDEVFLKVQLERSRRAVTGRGRKGASYSNLFSGLAKCMYCGSAMYFIDKGRRPKGRTYLQCSTSYNGGGCCPKHWNYENFELSFLHFTREIDLGAVLNATSYAEDRRLLAGRRAMIEESIHAKELELARVLGILSDTNAGYVQHKLDELARDIDRLKADVADIEHNPPTAPANLIDAEQFRSAVQAAGDAKASYELRSLLADHIRKMTVGLKVGSGGRMFEMENVLDAWNVDIDGPPPDRAEYLTHLEDMPDQTAPIIVVQLRDGTNREVVIDPDNPTKFLDHREVGPRGNRIHINWKLINKRAADRADGAVPQATR